MRPVFLGFRSSAFFRFRPSGFRFDRRRFKPKASFPSLAPVKIPLPCFRGRSRRNRFLSYGGWVERISSPEWSGHLGQGLKSDGEAELLNSSGQSPCQSLRVTAVVVVGPQVLVRQPALDHVVDALEDRSGYGDQSPLLAPLSSQAMVHRSQIAVFLFACG